MLQRKILISGLLLGLAAVMLVAGPALAENPADEKDHIIVRQGDDSLTMDKAGDILRIVRLEDGDEQVVELDLDQMGLVMEEALDDMGDLLAELSDMQMTFNLGEDNRLSFTQEDSYWEVDLDEIMTQVGSVLEGACEDMDLGEWTHNSRHHHYELTDDDLKDELNALRQEVRELRRELKKARLE